MSLKRTAMVVVSLLFLSVATTPVCAQGVEMVKATDPKAKPIYDAISALMEQIIAGDVDKAKVLFAGEKVEIELLNGYIEAVAGEKELAKVMDAKFGAKAGRLGALTRGVEFWARPMDFNNVIIKRDTASSSSTGPLMTFLELKKVGQKWMVSTLTCIDPPEDSIKRLTEYNAGVKTLTDDVSKGKYRKQEEAAAAFEEVEFLLRPKRGGGAPATRPASLPTR